jgi:hypothetical protein
MIYDNKIFIIVGLVLFIICIIIIFIYNPNTKKHTQYEKDIETINNILMNDARLHRLLMIEIINDKTENIINANINTNINTNVNTNILTNDSIRTTNKLSFDDLQSNIITYKKMIVGITQLGKCLVKYFGTTTTTKFISLIKQRNEILRDFYIKIRNYNYTNDIMGNYTNDSIRKDTNDTWNRLELDITTSISKKLEILTRDITDCIAASFNIRDIDTTSNKKRPLETYQRLYNLITMYDKELLNQAKSYVIKHYTISINCSQSSYDLTNHISGELSKLLLQKI